MNIIQIERQFEQILEEHRQTLDNLCSNQANVNFGYIRIKEMPNLKK